MAVQIHDYESIVLRTLRYGESDVIGHLFTREDGRRNVIAKGARKAKSRLGVRLEPFVMARVQIRQGRGDLGLVQSVSLTAAHDQIRSSWQLQQIAAAGLDMLARLSVEGVPNEAAFHLTTRFLSVLDSCDTDTEAGHAVLAGFQFKLLHTVGLAPQLGVCTRCARQEQLSAWSAADGGVVCSTCATVHDRAVEPMVHTQAVRATREPLTVLAQSSPDRAQLAMARRLFVVGMCAEHAGFRPKELASGS